MKTPEELAALKAELAALNQKLAALTEDELAQVAGGADNAGTLLCTKLDEALTLFSRLCDSDSLSVFSREQLSGLKRVTSDLRDYYYKLRNNQAAAQVLSTVLDGIRRLPEANSSELSQLISVLTAAYNLAVM